MLDPFLTLKNLVARFAETNNWVSLVGLQETYALAAMAFLLTSVIRVSLLHLELYGLNKQKGRNAPKQKKTDLIKQNDEFV